MADAPIATSVAEFKHRMSCCWYGDTRIVHAVRNVGIQNLQSACGKWVNGDRARRKTKPDVTCTACRAALEALATAEPPTTAIAPPVKHCRSCQCDPDNSDSLIIYAPNERMWGCCDTCNTVKWATEIYIDHRGSPQRSHHCQCCTHPHDLKPGGHNIPTRGGGGGA